MAYLKLGKGPPLVCVHGTLGDFRTWSAVMGPLSKKHRVISVSLRHFFPEHWDGVGDDYRMAQHVADLIAFIEQIGRRRNRGALATVHRVLAPHVTGSRTAMIPGAGHWMFEQAPPEFCRAVLEFLTAA